jgi:hypothetical protein
MTINAYEIPTDAYYSLSYYYLNNNKKPPETPKHLCRLISITEMKSFEYRYLGATKQTFFSKSSSVSARKRRCAMIETLAASLRHFTTVKDSENPCCEPTTFYNREGQWKPLLPAYDVLRRFSASAAKLMRERRERNPCCDPIRFYAVLYTFTS